MQPISKKQAHSLLTGEGRLIHGEYLDKYYRFAEGDGGEGNEKEIYLYNDCVVVKSRYCWHEKEIICWNVHAITADSDIMAALGAVAEKHENDELMAFVIGDIPMELKECHGGWMKFSRHGQIYQDENIRAMTLEDIDMLKAFCTVPEDDSWFGKSEIESFQSYVEYFKDNIEKGITFLGIFHENALAGLVTVHKHDHLGFAQVGDLFVKGKYRQNGYGKRLILGACGIYPDMEYIYNAAVQNNISILAALSSGFKLIGAELGVRPNPVKIL